MPHKGGPANISGVEYEQWFLTLLLAECFFHEDRFVTPQLREIITVDPEERIQLAAIDDIRLEKGDKTTYYTVKQNAPSGKWNATDLIHSKVIRKISRQHELTPDHQIVLLTQSDSKIIREDFKRASDCEDRNDLERELGKRISEWDRLRNLLECTDQELISIASKCSIETTDLEHIKKSAAHLFMGRVNLETQAAELLFNFAFDIAKHSKRVGQKEVIDYLKSKSVEVRPLFVSENVFELLLKASVSLENNPNGFSDFENTKVPRHETDEIYKWLVSPLEVTNGKKGSSVMLLSGEAGMGKTTVLKHLYDKLISSGIPVLGLKADRVNFTTQNDFKSELDLSDDLERLLVSSISHKGLTVVLIDQIDALSQSLSNDRKQILNYIGLIKRLSRLDQLRIVVSCRIYDLNYDPVLTQLKSKSEIEVKPLNNKELTSALTKLSIEKEALTESIKDLLKTPLHLDIFCRLNLEVVDLGSLKTLHSLYSELWKQKVTNCQLSLRDGLARFISAVCQDMFENQRIYSNHIDFESFEREKNYSQSEALIRNTGEFRRFSFFHQTLFDYSLARTFVTNGASISGEIRKSHQGLFIRNKVRAVVTFMREWKFELYIVEFKEILFSNEFRFHLKLLLINDLFLVEDPRSEENEIASKLIQIERFRSIVFESIRSPYWLNYLKQEIHKSLITNSKDYHYLIVGLCVHVMRKDEGSVFAFLRNLPEFKRRAEFIVDVMSDSKEFKTDSFQSLFLECRSEFRNRAASAQYFHFLTSTFNKWQDWTLDEAFKDLKERSQEADRSKYYFEFLPYGTKEFFESINSKGLAISYPFFKKSLIYLVESHRLDFDKRFLISDSAYNSYIPEKRETRQHHFIFPNSIIKHLIDSGEAELGFVEDELRSLIDSRYEATAIVALSVLRALPNLIIIEGFEFVWSWLHSEKYIVGSRSTKYILAYINAVYGIWPEEKRNKLNGFILDYKDPIRAHNEVRLNDYYGDTQNFLIASIPEVERHPELKRLKHELQRRLSVKKRLRQQKNIREKTKVTHLRKESVQKMSFDSWVSFFSSVVYKYGDQLSWDRHYENLRSLRECIKEQPNNHLRQMVYQFTESTACPPSYALAGIEEFHRLQRNDWQFLDLLEAVAKRTDLSNYEMRETINLATYFQDEDMFSQAIFDWMIVNYKTGDSEASTSLEEDSGESWVVKGRSSVKGACLSGLIHMAQTSEHAKVVFKLIEESEDLELPIRAVAVRELVYLNFFDKERSLTLFVKLSENQPYQILEAGLWSLQYMSHVNFDSISEVTRASINLVKSDSSLDLLGGMLALAAHYNYPKSEELLEMAINKDVKYRLSALEMAINVLTEEGRESEFLTELLYRFLEEEDHDFIYKYGSLFRKIESMDFLKWLKFIKVFTHSAIGRRRDSSYYNYLLKCCDTHPEMCIDLVINHDNPEPDFRYSILQEEPLQLTINSYNALGRYDKSTEYNEKAMDAFDKALEAVEYRRDRDNFLKALDSY